MAKATKVEVFIEVPQITLMKQRFLKITAIFMLAMFQLVSWAQVESGLHLGNLEFIYSSKMETDKRALSENLISSEEEIKTDFINKVGGVAFVQVAQPDMQIHSFQLGCDKDNNTAYVEINGVTYPIPLPVWQLQPIVEYANDEKYDAAFSIYGDYLGKSPCVYQRAFIDELLGLRLLQADILLFERDAVLELPADDAGKYVMAKSESDKFADFSSKRWVREMNWENLQGIYVGQYHTYILTDFKQPITFHVDNGSVKIEGNPYYRFYKQNKNNYDFVFKEKLTESLRRHWNEIYEMNPVVMDAVLNTCQWAAFFRYAKLNFPENWHSFLMQVKSLQYDAPKVLTPVGYYCNYNATVNVFISNMEAEVKACENMYNTMEAQKVRRKDYENMANQYAALVSQLRYIEWKLVVFSEKLKSAKNSYENKLERVFKILTDYNQYYEFSYNRKKLSLNALFLESKEFKEFDWEEFINELDIPESSKEVLHVYRICFDHYTAYSKEWKNNYRTEVMRIESENLKNKCKSKADYYRERARKH